MLVCTRRSPRALGHWRKRSKPASFCRLTRRWSSRVTIQLLVQAYESGQQSVIYPVFQGRRGHPPLIRRNVLADVLRGDEPEGLRSLLARHENSAGEVAVIDEGIHLDLDTPADLARACALAESFD